MPKLLYIESSPRKERSHSIEIARLFLESYIKAHPSDDVETLNLWETDLPPMDGPAIEARYTSGCDQDLTPEQRASFGEISKWANQFKTASKYLFSLPMWNFSVPYRLKHYIDLITQPGLTFEFTPEHGYQGMVKGRTAAVIYARGGEYSKESGVADKDFQKSYFVYLYNIYLL